MASNKRIWTPDWPNQRPGRIKANSVWFGLLNISQKHSRLLYCVYARLHRRIRRPRVKNSQGSSRYFAVALVVFEDPEEALACDQRIELLRREIGWPSGAEFHFRRNSDRVRRAFLKAIAPYNFFYYGIIINKDPKDLAAQGFTDKASFYKYACGLVFENAREKLLNATVVIDKSGSLDFRNQLEKYLRRMNQADGSKMIKKVKMQRSTSNNLLQLADYIAGVIHQQVQGRKHAKEYHKLIAHREINVQLWPK